MPRPGLEEHGGKSGKPMRQTTRVIKKKNVNEKL